MKHRNSIVKASAGVLDAMGALSLAVGNLLAVVVGCPRRCPAFTLKETRLMYIVKATNPDVRYGMEFQVVDSEGSQVPGASVSVEVASDGPGAVEVIPDADARTGTLRFGVANADGTPAVANVTVAVKLPDGTLVGSFGDQFTVTPGDPSAIAGGRLTVPDLTPA